MKLKTILYLGRWKGGMENLIIYHDNCWDGFCSAWIANRCLIENFNEVHMFPGVYSEEPPYEFARDKDVYILDFSYSPEKLDAILETAHRVVLIDHHITAISSIKEYFANYSVIKEWVLDVSKSGAMLTWEYFYPGIEPPLLVKYVQDRDLWKYELEKSRETNEFIRCFPLTLASLDYLARTNYNIGNLNIFEAAGIGHMILKSKEIQIDATVNKAQKINFLNYLVPCVNCTAYHSEVGHELAVDAPFVITWEISNNKLVLSFRSSESGEDVSIIAKQIGGGGHQHASGASFPLNSDFTSNFIKLLGENCGA